ncbi:MAG: phage tail protein, partial [Bryobacteraceae bacterium]
QVAKIPSLFDPAETPEEFLSWLGGWLGFHLRAELPVARRRRLLSEMGMLYRIRGTRAYLERILRLTLDALPLVSDIELPGLQIAKFSTVAENTFLGGGPPFAFRVTLAFSRRDPRFLEQQSRLAREVIELEKPAYTRYELLVTFPRFRVGSHSTVGVDTVLAEQSELRTESGR